MEKRIATVIFDFEGTLVDFQWRLAEAEAQLREAFSSLGYGTAGNYAQMWNAAVDAAMNVATEVEADGATDGATDGAANDAANDVAGVGTGVTPIQKRLASMRRRLAPIYDHWDADALTRWAPRPGAADLLRELAGRGMRTAMVSNVGRAALVEALLRFDFESRLAPVVSRDDVHWLKPRAEGIRRVLAHWKAAPEEALFVGDSKADVLAARAAGVRVAIVRGGECEASEFDALAPDYLVSALDEIAPLASAAAARK